MATIVKRPSGKWQATVRKDGQSRSKSFLKRADATKWARETELSADRGLLTPDLSVNVSEMTLGDLLAYFAFQFGKKYLGRA